MNSPGLAFWLLCAIFAIGGVVGAVRDARRAAHTLLAPRARARARARAKTARFERYN